MDYNIEYIIDLHNKLQEFNKIPLNELNLHKDGKTLDISEDVLNLWKFIGLNNVEFIITEFYDGGFVNGCRIEE